MAVETCITIDAYMHGMHDHMKDVLSNLGMASLKSALYRCLLRF